MFASHSAAFDGDSAEVASKAAGLTANLDGFDGDSALKSEHRAQGTETERSFGGDQKELTCAFCAWGPGTRVRPGTKKDSFWRVLLVQVRFLV